MRRNSDEVTTAVLLAVGLAVLQLVRARRLQGLSGMSEVHRCHPPPAAICSRSHAVHEKERIIAGQRGSGRQAGSPRQGEVMNEWCVHDQDAGEVDRSETWGLRPQPGHRRARQLGLLKADDQPSHPR
jgi:hypothetical protein